MKGARWMGWIVLCLALTACAQRSIYAPTYDPKNQARIRVFHASDVYLYFGDICDGPVNGMIHASAGGWSQIVPNQRIGMPITEHMPMRSYHEYVIPPGQRLTVRAYWQNQNHNGTWTTCGPEHIVFTPEAGQDYDAFMSFQRGYCQGLQVRQFKPMPDGSIQTKPPPIHYVPFRSCRD